jgi:hypothetical protein
MHHGLRGLAGDAEDSEKSQPDWLSSTEYLPRFDSRSFPAPEAELVAAVLDDAIICFIKYATAKQRREQRLFRETEEWLFAEDANWPFSFENLCGFLEINPNYLRSGLMRLKQQLEAGESKRHPNQRQLPISPCLNTSA